MTAALVASVTAGAIRLTARTRPEGCECAGDGGTALMTIGFALVPAALRRACRAGKRASGSSVQVVEEALKQGVRGSAATDLLAAEAVDLVAG